MRVALLLVASVAAAFALSGPARSAPNGPTLAASPNPVHFGQTLAVTGRTWPVIEFCRRTVRFRLTSAQNAVSLGKTRVRTNGRFTFDYKVLKRKVGAGKWTLRARMNCEGGEDGSPNPVRRSVPLTIKR